MVERETIAPSWQARVGARMVELAQPGYVGGLMALGMLVAFGPTFLAREYVALAYSVLLVASGLAFRRLRRAGASAPLDRLTKRLCAASVAVSTLIFAIAGLISVHSTRPRTLPWYDQGAYLVDAAKIRDMGGPFVALGRCFRGEYVKSDRDPLFSLVLSPFAVGERQSVQFFERAKLVAWGFGVLAVGSAGFVVWRLFSPAAAVVAVFGLSMNHFLLQHSSLVNCEPLYVLLAVWAVYLMVLGVERRWLWTAAGAVTGLAHMSKGSGILFAGAFAVAAAVKLRGRVLREKHVYGFGLAFFLVLTPFLWHNAVKYGNPLYNPNAKLMWADNWGHATSLSPEQVQQLGFWPYMQKHTLGEVASRMFTGLMEVRRYFVTTGELRVMKLKYAYGGCVVLLAVLGWVFDRDRFRQCLFAAVVVFFFLLIGWLRGIGTSEKHILPLVPFVYAYFGHLLSEACVAGEAGRAPAWRRAAIVHLAAGVLCILLLVITKWERLFTSLS